MSTYTYCKQNNGETKDRILVPSDDYARNIGQIKYGIFTKFNFQSSKHICFKYKAIGLDEGAFLNYILPNALLIVCPDKEKHITYSIDVSLFKRMATSDDLGWGTQLFCPIKYFQAEHSNKPNIQMELNFGGEKPW